MKREKKRGRGERDLHQQQVQYIMIGIKNTLFIKLTLH